MVVVLISKPGDCVKTDSPGPPCTLTLSLGFSPAGLGPKLTASMAPRTLRLVQVVMALVVVTVFISLLALFVVGKFSGDFSHNLFFFCAKVPRDPGGSLLDVSAL